MFGVPGLAALGGAGAFVLLTVLLKGRPLLWLLDLVEWLFERPVRAAVLALVAVAALGWWNVWSIDASRDAWRTAAHLETKSRVEAAAKGATDLAEANRDAVEAVWRAQIEEAQHANEILRDRNRALLSGWLQSGAGRTDPGGAGGADLSGAAAVPAGSVHDAAPPLVSGAVVPVAVADLAATADAFAQLEALIGFVTAATAVPTSPATETAR